MKPRYTWRGPGVFLALVCSALPLLAVQMIPMSVQELTARAEVVLHAQVLAKSSQRDAEGRIFTRVELGVLEAWKGGVTGPRFKVVLAGGTIGDQRVGISGQADYHPGEEVVAFLRLNQRGEGVTLGLAQGKFEVWQEPAGGAKWVRNLFLGRPQAPVSAAQPSNSRDNGRIALTDLRRQVRGTVQ